MRILSRAIPLETVQIPGMGFPGTEQAARRTLLLAATEYFPGK